MEALRLSFKTEFVYRSSTIFNSIGSVFKILISISLWKYVYSYNIDMINYMTIYVIASNIIRMFYSEQISKEIGEKLYDGSFALELVRPNNYIYISYLKILGKLFAQLFTKGLIVIFVFFPIILLRLLLEENERNSILYNLGLLVLWIIILAFILLYSYDKIINKLVIQGG